MHVNTLLCIIINQYWTKLQSMYHFIKNPFAWNLFIIGVYRGILNWKGGLSTIAQNLEIIGVYRGILNWRIRPSMVDLLIQITCFVKKYSFSIENSWSNLVSSRRSTVIILPFSKDSLSIGDDISLKISKVKLNINNVCNLIKLVI